MTRVVSTSLVVALLQPLSAPLRIVDRGAQSVVRTERFVVVRDEGEWAGLWTAHAPARPRPSVDFATEMVVGVFAGTRPTPGYGVDIAGWREAAGIVVVVYRETEPDRGAIAPQVLTSPYALAAIPRRAGEVTFEKAEK